MCHTSGMLTTHVTNRTHQSQPKLPYQQLKQAILGTTYEVSVVFIGTKRAKELNQTYRGKNYIPNVLSFPLSPAVGEVFICPVVAKKEAPKQPSSYRSYVGYLYIHALLHLKGLEHGATMETTERFYVAKYKLDEN